jgi:hypothetical protein
MTSEAMRPMLPTTVAQSQLTHCIFTACSAMDLDDVLVRHPLL